MAGKKLSKIEVARIVDNEGIGYAIRSYTDADSIADPELAGLWRQADEILAKIETICEHATEAAEECEFEQVNPHEWHCTVHDVLVVASTDEPVNCPVRQDAIV